MIDKTKGLQNIVSELAAFCKATRNVHTKIKDWARELSDLTAELRQDARRQGELVENNYNKVKKMRRVLVGYADTSLRVMKANFTVASVVASSSVAQRWAVAGPADPNPQADARKPAGRKRRHVEKATLGELSSQPVPKDQAEPFKGKKKMQPKKEMKKTLPPTHQQGVLISGTGGKSYAEIAKR